MIARGVRSWGLRCGDAGARVRITEMNKVYTRVELERVRRAVESISQLPDKTSRSFRSEGKRSGIPNAESSDQACGGTVTSKGGRACARQQGNDYVRTGGLQGEVTDGTVRESSFGNGRSRTITAGLDEPVP